ncbi:MAG: hypothetical protein KAX30_04320 [Candidatus Atribacteria bacterium]|nr:hypothetical protein [Candidatus Atribacteria bacterium]
MTAPILGTPWTGYQQWDVDFGDFVPYGGEEELRPGQVRWNPQTRHFEHGPAEEEAPDRPFSHFRTEQQRPTSTTTKTTVSPTKPTMPLPTFTLPERDPERVKELRAEALFPMRGFRQEARRMLPKIANLPGPVQKEAMRGWTEGLGTGISSITGKAGLEAERLYGIERGEEISALRQNFLAQLQDYLSGYGSTQTTISTHGYGEKEEKYDPWAQDWIKFKPSWYKD